MDPTCRVVDTLQNEGQCWLATQLESLWTGAALTLVDGNIFHGFHNVPMAAYPPTPLILDSLIGNLVGESQFPILFGPERFEGACSNS